MPPPPIHPSVSVQNEAEESSEIRVLVTGFGVSSHFDFGEGRRREGELGNREKGGRMAGRGVRGMRKGGRTRSRRLTYIHTTAMGKQHNQPIQPNRLLPPVHPPVHSPSPPHSFFHRLNLEPPTPNHPVDHPHSTPSSLRPDPNHHPRPHHDPQTPYRPPCRSGFRSEIILYRTIFLPH